MQWRCLVSILSTAMIGVPSLVQAAPPQRLNPMITLLEQHKPVLGVYRPGHPPHGALAQPASPQALARMAQQTVAYKSGDFVFDGSMEDHFDQVFGLFAEFAEALREAGPLSSTPYPHIAYPLVVKIPAIAPDPAKAASNISAQLNAGVSGVMFVEVESPEEAARGIAAMRFKANGGTRPESVGAAPAFWGLSEQQYRQKADVWPLNPQGELINWTIVESKTGLERVREIAAVKGIGVLWVGAGTLRRVFSTPGPDGKPVLDESAWEGAIQQVLSACKEFEVPCGFPAGPADIEMRMKQGFSVFVMGGNEAGFEAVKIGRKAAGRAPVNE